MKSPGQQLLGDARVQVEAAAAAIPEHFGMWSVAAAALTIQAKALVDAAAEMLALAEKELNRV